MDGYSNCGRLVVFHYGGLFMKTFKQFVIGLTLVGMLAGNAVALTPQELRDLAAEVAGTRELTEDFRNRLQGENATLWDGILRECKFNKNGDLNRLAYNVNRLMDLLNDAAGQAEPAADSSENSGAQSGHAGVENSGAQSEPSQNMVINNQQIVVWSGHNQPIDDESSDSIEVRVDDTPTPTPSGPNYYERGLTLGTGALAATGAMAYYNQVATEALNAVTEGAFTNPYVAATAIVLGTAGAAGALGGYVAYKAGQMFFGNNAGNNAGTDLDSSNDSDPNVGIVSRAKNLVKRFFVSNNEDDSESEDNTIVDENEQPEGRLRPLLGKRTIRRFVQSEEEEDEPGAKRTKANEHSSTEY